jgi:hypothetical protein
MARTSGRAKEFAVRLALGAGRGRLVRLIVVETMVLTMFGAALGMVLAYWTDRALAVLAPPHSGGSALIVDVNPEWRVFLFTLGVAIAVSLLSASGAAIQSTRPDLPPALKGEGGVRAPGRLSLTNGLVVTQVALCSWRHYPVSLSGRYVRCAGTPPRAQEKAMAGLVAQRAQPLK